MEEYHLEDRYLYNCKTTTKGTQINCFPVQPCFHIDYISLKEDIDIIQRTYGERHELQILCNHLEEYKNIFS